MSLQRFLLFAGVSVAATLAGSTTASAQDKPQDRKLVVAGTPVPPPAPGSTPDSVTEGSVTVNGQPIAYRAIAGTLTVGATDIQDTTLGFDGKPPARLRREAPREDRGRPRPPPACSMSPTSRRTPPPSTAPSPSSITAAPAPPPCGCTWGPSARAASPCPTPSHPVGAPYNLVNNDSSLLDVSDLVFIDAPLDRLQPHLR